MSSSTTHGLRNPHSHGLSKHPGVSSPAPWPGAPARSSQLPGDGLSNQRRDRSAQAPGLRGTHRCASGTSAALLAGPTTHQAARFERCCCCGWGRTTKRASAGPAHAGGGEEPWRMWGDQLQHQSPPPRGDSKHWPRDPGPWPQSPELDALSSDRICERVFKQTQT